MRAARPARGPALLIALTLATVIWTLGGRPAQAQGFVCSAFGGGAPYAFQTYEADRPRGTYLSALTLAAQAQLFPDDARFQYAPLQTGPDGQRRADPLATIPPALLYAIGWIESSLNQAAIFVPYHSVGDVLVSSSCAYGMLQVASAFFNEGETPSQRETLMGTHFAYNAAAGAQILVDKWNADFFPTVGASDPGFSESWYYATWAYNGWALVNHPAGPEADPFRATPYPCTGPFNGVPYQELVFGCLVNPPEVDGVRLWTPQPVRLPDLAVLSQPGGPLDPAVYFAGWNAVFAEPITGEDASHPFTGMAMPLPAGAQPVTAQPLEAAQAASQRQGLFGAPGLAVDTTTLALDITEDTVESGAFTIRNTGTGLLVYRLAADQPWLDLSVDGGIAIGSDWLVASGRPRDATVEVRLQAEALGEGFHQAVILVEALLPGGGTQTHAVAVEVNKQGVPAYEAGTPRS